MHWLATGQNIGISLGGATPIACAPTAIVAAAVEGHRESSQLCVQPMPARCGTGRADRGHGCLQLDLFAAVCFGVDHVYVVVAVACHRCLVRRAANPVPRLVATLITAGRPNFIDSAMKSAMAQSVVGVAVVMPWFERRL
jgi:hypothetical protein